MAELTHFNEQGRAKMVDVTDKAITHRTAVAAGEIHMAPETLQKIKDGTMKKGDVLVVLEAMKMENEIVAPQDGTIASIETSKGASVETGAVLATMN